MRLVVGVHRCGRGARGYCRHLEQCCIKVRLLAAQLHHNWRTTRPHSATRCASTCETVPQVCAEPAVTIAHQSVKSTCPSRKVCASHFVKPERRRTSPARSPNSSASSCEDRGAAAGRASGVRHGQTDESAAPPWCGASKWGATLPTWRPSTSGVPLLRELIYVDHSHRSRRGLRARPRRDR